MLVPSAAAFALPAFPWMSFLAPITVDGTAAMLRKHYIIGGRWGSKRAGGDRTFFFSTKDTGVAEKDKKTKDQGSKAKLGTRRKGTDLKIGHYKEPPQLEEADFDAKEFFGILTEVADEEA